MKMKFIVAGLLVAGVLALGQKVSKGEGEVLTRHNVREVEVRSDRQGYVEVQLKWV